MVPTQKSTNNGALPESIDRARQRSGLETVGIGDMCVSVDPTDVLVTYSLGSCVGLALYDASCGVGGLIHCMLPLSRMNKQKANARPCMFVDTGVSAMLQEMFDRGAQRKNIIARVAGGAHMLDRKRTFRVGQRNYAVLRKILWKNDILIESDDVGGTVSRTMFFHVGSGDTAIKTGGSITLL
ncbi:MAG: chemotaxis protein CheD [Planctomycetota bacterium]